MKISIESKDLMSDFPEITDKEICINKLLSFCKSTQLKKRIKELFIEYDTIHSGYYYVEKTCNGKFQVVDKRPAIQQQIMKIINRLPWSVGEMVNVKNEKNIETVLEMESIIKKDELDVDFEYSADDMKYIQDTILEKLGHEVVLDFKFVEDMLEISDNCIGELYIKD